MKNKCLKKFVEPKAYYEREKNKKIYVKEK